MQRIENGIVTMVEVSSARHCGILGHGSYSGDRVVTVVEVDVAVVFIISNLKTRWNGKHMLYKQDDREFDWMLKFFFSFHSTFFRNSLHFCLVHGPTTLHYVKQKNQSDVMSSVRKNSDPNAPCNVFHPFSHRTVFRNQSPAFKCLFSFFL